MTSAHDPLREPLRLLRETSLRPGFEERLAERLATAHRQSNVVRFPGRTRVLLLVAAIAIPAAAAAAGAYYAQQRAAPTSPDENPERLEAKPFGTLPKGGFARPVPRTAPTMPSIEKLPAPRTRSAPKAAERSNGPEPMQTVSPPAANATPRIEALDPFAAKAATSKPLAATPEGVNVSESLRKATEQGAARPNDASARSTRRDTNANENRGSDAAQQARERVQARERKGQ